MKQDLLNLYYVDIKLIRDLHNVDDNVMSISPQTGKANRPFVGVIVIMDTQKYCIPLTSPNKDKFKVKSKEDFIKIPDPKLKDEHGAPKTIGILNLNNMIPVSDEFIQKVDLSSSGKTEFNKNLLINDLRWCRENSSVIINRANKLYNKITLTPEKDRNLTKRCCNFKKLEAVLDKCLARIGQTNSPHSEKPNASDDLAQKEAAVKKCDEILKANPDLKAKLNAAAIEYSKKYNVALLDSSASAEERYEMRNKILKENPELKEEYVKAKNEYEQRQLVPTDSKQTKSFAQGLDEFAKRQKGQSSPKPPAHNNLDNKHRK